MGTNGLSEEEAKHLQLREEIMEVEDLNTLYEMEFRDL